MSAAAPPARWSPRALGGAVAHPRADTRAPAARRRRCPFEGVDPVYLSLSRLRRRRYDGAIEVATELLSNNALDQQVRPPAARIV